MRSTDFFRYQPAVFILESPSAQDVLDDRDEGAALAAALRLAQVPSMLLRTPDRATLSEAFGRMAKAPLRGPDGRIVVPHVHISAHGNGEGVALTNGERVGWADLRQLLLGFARATDRFSTGGMALLELCMSSCEGANARKMFDLGPPHPCAGIVGPRKPVTWSDSLVAFIAYYHQSIIKDVRAVDAVPIMNRAAGIEEFGLFTPADFAERISKQGMAHAASYEQLRLSQTSPAPSPPPSSR